MPVEDVFDELNAQPVPTLEHLGRAIVDAQGVPSGSPANYEYTRGKTGVAPVDLDAVIGALASDPALQLPADA